MNMYGTGTVQTPAVVTNVSPNGTVTETPVVVTNNQQGVAANMGMNNWGADYNGGAYGAYGANSYGATMVQTPAVVTNMTGGMVTQTNAVVTNLSGSGVGYGIGGTNVEVVPAPPQPASRSRI